MRKAQVEAPVELFVAVIILALSMSLAFFVFAQTEGGKCVSTLKTEVVKLTSALQDVSLASPPTSETVTFRMPNCPGFRVEGLQFVRFNDPAQCRLCASHFGGCWQIRPVTFSEDRLQVIHDAITCVPISGNVIIVKGDDADCAELNSHPCPTGVSCTTDLSSSALSSSEWSTLARGSGQTTYEVTLTKKSGATGPGGASTGEQAVVAVCAKPVN